MAEITDVPPPHRLTRALCTLSGGFDSAAALLWSLERWPTEALFVAYGQRYERQERRASTYLVTGCPAIAKHPNFCGLRSVSADMCLMPPGDPWVPYRNLVLAALATNVAGATRQDVVVFGSKSTMFREGDPISYLDSTLSFYMDLEGLVSRYTEPQHRPPPAFVLPLVGWSKRKVLESLCDAGVDVRALWNCYRGDDQAAPCGVCEHCVITQPLIEEVLTARQPVEVAL